MYETKYYNGTNHEIKFYNCSTDYAVNRKGQYFLTNQNATSTMILPQQRALCASSTPLPLKTGSPMQLFTPEVSSMQLDPLMNANAYDAVIVSSIYSHYALQTLAQNVDYVDRLFTLIPVYREDPQTHSYTEKIGAVGLRKVSVPRMPWEYVVEFRAGKMPSVSAMMVCLSMHEQYLSQLDANARLWLEELHHCISQISNVTPIFMKGGLVI